MSEIVGIGGRRFEDITTRDTKSKGRCMQLHHGYTHFATVLSLHLVRAGMNGGMVAVPWTLWTMIVVDGFSS